METSVFSPVDDIVKQETAPLATLPDSAASIASILDRAVQGGMSPEALEKIVNLYERVADRAAAQEFAGAMARFQSACPSIRKTSMATIATNNGGSYNYWYAELDEIAACIRPILSAEGLSYTWDSTETGGMLTCVCTIRHVNGHSVKAQFMCPTDSPAKMSGAQKVAGALTFARRQSLVQALGLTTCDKDTDAGMAQVITEHQAANIQMMMDEVKADKAKFLEFLGVSKIQDIPASRFSQAIAALEKKRKAQR